MNFPEPTAEQKARDEALRLQIEASAAAFAILSPVERALAKIRQRQSFVRGHGIVEQFTDPASILADEVVTLRAQLAAAEAQIAAISAEIEWSRS